MKSKLFFSVGEPSGDLHAAKLIRHLGQRDASIEVSGFGGPLMASAGCELLYPLTELAVVGFVEVLPKLREFFRVADLASKRFDECRPDAVVLVDFPGFNWHIAKRAKQRGIPVYYYLPPQLWAWGGWRIRKMRKYVDYALCNLPFELQWYQSQGMPAHYVGHPFFDEVYDRRLDEKFMQRWSDAAYTNVAVLPGSRSREVKHIWPMQLETIRQLAPQFPQARFHVACLKDGHGLWCKQQLQPSDANLPINFFVGRTSEVISVADCALAKSGSVSLELMARSVPTVVVYHVGRVLYQVAKRLTKVNTFTLPNMLAGESVMSEHLAVGDTSTAIRSSTAALAQLLGSSDERNRQRLVLQQLAEQHAQAGASCRAADFLMEQLSASSRIISTTGQAA